ncbi:hypothetical protein ASE14_10325 [Agromyces sp. Root81]|uniref:DUF402 domain-containing protein n=1 Tax=Agromyces sp. Root81 TaxID=1736601 RepID=UPI0006F9560F|nr:DUF402 domain-containing protein [Agromyces sp. Root81]KRC61288.1 hypothetical protein ASE14_10325 [Agromyces sp. Root81]
MTLRDDATADAPQTPSGNASEPAPFERGTAVAIRGIHSYGQHGTIVGFAVAGIVVADSDDLTVVCTPAGSAVRARGGSGNGPNGRLVLADDWNGTHDARPWDGDAVVRVHRRGEPWSVWRWHDGRDWSSVWYGNLEEPWRRSAVGFDTEDWTLDVVGEGDPIDGPWEVGYKDEDELAWLLEVGAMSSGEAERARLAGERLTAIAQGATWPFDADWTPWVPDEAWGAVPMPVDWRRLN